MFVDQVRIKLKAGNGGDGHTSFHTEKFVANGGPDGGDGGRGGSIVLVASESVNTLIDYYYKKHFRAADGENGGIKKCSGKSAEDLVLRVPCGTIVRDVETGKVVADLFYPDQPVTLLKGGRGGLGNAHFATSRRQAPRFSQKGERTTERAVDLELKTIADVGLVGYPNVGKSTLLSVISAARPKIANYHFTTVVPNLGMVRRYDQSFLVADIPGLIDGAAEGAGLGHEFLRHVERTRLLVHVVDISGSEGRDPIEDYDRINAELSAYNTALGARPQIVALNKCDLLENDEPIEAMRKHLPEGTPLAAISGATRYGVDDLVDTIAKTLADIPPVKPEELEVFEWEAPDASAYLVEKLDDGVFEISGGFIDRLAQNVVFDNYDSLQYFQRMLRLHGVVKALSNAGAKSGDTVVMKDMEFEFIE